MFGKAKPIWVKNAKCEYNNFFGFTVRLKGPAGKYLLKIAAADCYQVYLNGDFLLAGPARTASGFCRTDELEFVAGKADSILTVLVAEYNVNSFEYAAGRGFLQAEVLKGENICGWTDENTEVFEIFERQKKVQRYSFQRAFTEIWEIGRDFAEIFTGQRISEKYSAEQTQARKLLPRASFIPKFGRLSSKIISGGFMHSGEPYENTPILNMPPFLQPTPVFKTYGQEDLKTDLVHELRGLKTDSFDVQATDGRLCCGTFRIYDFGVDGCGFADLTVKVKKKCVLYILFDEILVKQDVDFFRLNCVNCIKYAFEEGEYHVISLEPYCFRYAKIYCDAGSVDVIDFSLKEVSNPDAEKVMFQSGDAGIQRIFNAALNTFRYNAVDILMDCPSRERAGWLCDGYFTGKAERVLTGANKVEHDFLENFILENKFDHIPEGMIPMCYPSSHPDGNYIPTWAMWYILELHRYWNDSGDRDLVDRSEKRVRQILSFLERYENEFGLLENLEGWVFIEWSRAAEFANGVNYCVNMLYALTLQRAGELFDETSLILKSQKLKEEIRSRSYKDNFFADHSVRNEEGDLVLCNDISEVCQYYAFFTETATAEIYPGLWERLLKDFGPERRRENKFPQVCFANAFIGNFLRLSLLYEHGLREQLIKECYGYFLYMADTTNTLWEHDTVTASCCHGFTSYLTYWLSEYNEIKNGSAD